MLTQRIRRIAEELGIDAIGFVPIEKVAPQAVAYYDSWLADGKQASMEYLEKHKVQRENPKLILPEAQSAIVIAVSYYPTDPQPSDAPQIAKYALGRDYHKVIKQLLLRLAKQIEEEIGAHDYRPLVDTAPFMERYWAQKSGIGFVGKNSNLIIPRVGSFVFLGELLTSLELSTDTVCSKMCGSCHKCIDACPTGALTDDGLDARRCINYLTIEHKGEIPEDLSKKLGKRLYGCDTCQDVCPYNRTPRPTRLFPPAPQLLELRGQDIKELDESKYARLFHGSAATRAKLEGMQRNANLYTSNNKQS